MAVFLFRTFTQRTASIYSKSSPRQRTNRERQFLCFVRSAVVCEILRKHDLPMPGRIRDAIQRKDCLPDFRQNNHSRGSYRCRCYTFAPTGAMLSAKPCLTTLPVPNSYHFSNREQQGKFRYHHTICPSPYDRRHRLCHRYSCRRKSPVPDTSPAGSCHNLWHTVLKHRIPILRSFCFNDDCFRSKEQRK